MEEELTTGQKLLGSLRSSEAVRKGRYASTVQAKMKEARDRLNKQGLTPKHPVESDSAIFGKAEAEVKWLLPDVAYEQPSLTGITAMLARKADRHEAAWQQYCTRRDLARQHHDKAAAAVAAALKEALDGVNRDVEQHMAVLAQDKVTVLDQQHIVRVWDRVLQLCSSTAGWINGLAAELKANETTLRQSVESALSCMVAEMAEIAHLDEGRLQRLVEQEALELNKVMLDNRQVAADVLQRLHAQQVLLEQSYRQRWEAGFTAWRILRSRHAIHCLCQHVKADMSEPAARLDIFSQLRAAQEDAHGQFQQLCTRAGQMLAPHFSSEAVRGWVEAAHDWCQHWKQQLEQRLQELRSQEDHIEQQLQTELTALHAEVLDYKGFTSKELDSMLHEEAQPVLQHRRTAALDLLQQATDFLGRQQAEWQLATQVLSNWLTSLVTLFEEHKTKHLEGENSIKALLRAMRQQFEQADADREAALDAAILSVRQGSSESVLNQRVDAALQQLLDIEAGYRAYAASAADTVSAYPGRVKQQEDLYSTCLCGLLHVQACAAGTYAAQDNVRQEPRNVLVAPAAATPEAAAVVPQPMTQQQPGPASAQRWPLSAHCPNSAQRLSSNEQQQHSSLELPNGSAYALLHELWQALLSATPKPWKQSQQDMAAAEASVQVGPVQDAAQGPLSSTAGAPAAAAVSAIPPAAATGGSARGPSVNSGKLTGKHQAGVAVAAAAAAATQAAAVAAEGNAAATATAADLPPPCPAALSGEPLCKTLDVPDDAIQGALQQLQVSLLSEMESFRTFSHGAADMWAEAAQGVLMEELDARLSAHRPRAGRIEEEVRAARSIELLAQRRRVEAHMRSQSKAVKQQAASFEDSLQALRADAASWKAKILKYERLLGNALSLKGVDITWREAQALRVKSEKQLMERVEQLKEVVGVSCGAVVARNREFETANLKSFADGGNYAETNVATYKAGIAGIDQHMAHQHQKQQEQLTAVQQELSTDMTAALTSIEQLLPSHKQDMALIETLNRFVEGAKKKAGGELQRNSHAADSIHGILQQLQGSLARAAAKPQAGSAEVQLQGQQPSGLRDCQHVLQQVNDLRHQLLKQAQVLERLQSDSIPHLAFTLALPSELQPLLLPDFRAAAASTVTTAAAGGDAAATPKGTRPGTGQKAAAKLTTGGPAAGAKASAPAKPPQPVAAAAGPQVVDALIVPLAKDIRAVIETAKQEVEAAAKAYYAAKDKEASRPIRYPTIIAPTLKELMAGVDTVLSALTDTLKQHMMMAAKQLHAQVVQAHRLLERVPSTVLQLLTGHLLVAAHQQHSKLLGTYADRRQQLELQLEQHKARLHPGMLHPNRLSELEWLTSAEAARQTAAAELTAACAASCLALISSHASQLSFSAAELCKLLLGLLDGCVMPGDLVPPGEGDVDVLAGLEPMSMVQLERLGLAQEEAMPTGPAPTPPVTAAGSKAAAKSTKGSESSTDATAASSAAPRPFVYVSWQLSPGNLTVESLGWLPADQQAVGEGAKAYPAASQAMAMTGGQPAIGQAPTTPQKMPATSAGTAGPALQQKVPTASAAPAVPLAPAHPQPEKALGAVVVGYDTPCQRAVIRSQKAVILCIQQSLSATVADLKQHLYQWLGQEQQWGCAWARMIDEIDMV